MLWFWIIMFVIAVIYVGLCFNIDLADLLVDAVGDFFDGDDT